MAKRNIYFGFGPAPKKERLTVYRRPKERLRRGGRGPKGTKRHQQVPTGLQADVVAALVDQGYKKSDVRKAVSAATGSDFGSLFRSALNKVRGQNPRGRHVAKSRKRKKRKNPRKGKMPAGLRKYWAKKRAAKARRKNARKVKRTKVKRNRVRRRRSVPKVRRFRRTVRKANIRRRRRPRRNPPRRKSVLRIKAPAGLGPKGLRKFRALAARAYGVPARIVKR